MRALVQRVRRASVTVDGDVTGAIGPGLLVLLGVTHTDTAAAADRLAEKVRNLRVFPDAEGRMNEPLGDREVLCVSQFTLYGDTRKGNRPAYVDAARPEVAEPLYEHFCWRIEIQPRLASMAGLELGTGVHLCVVAPEQAAAELREL